MGHCKDLGLSLSEKHDPIYVYTHHKAAVVRIQGDKGESKKSSWKLLK